jgi:hypothetical protein
MRYRRGNKKMVEDLLPDEDSGKVRHTRKRDGNIANVYFDGDGEGVDASVGNIHGVSTETNKHFLPIRIQ